MDADGSPVTVSWSGDSRRNIIVWMDHRAVQQAERINSCNSPVLQYCGGGLSPEMQPPKVLRLHNFYSNYWVSKGMVFVGALHNFHFICQLSQKSTRV